MTPSATKQRATSVETTPRGGPSPASTLPDQTLADAHHPAVGQPSSADHEPVDTQVLNVGGTPLPDQTQTDAQRLNVRQPFPADHLKGDTQVLAVGGPSSADQPPRDTHATCVCHPLDRDQSSVDAQGRSVSVSTLASDHCRSEAHGVSVGGNTLAGDQSWSESHCSLVARNDFALLLAAEMLDDIERVRIANQHRARQLAEHGANVKLYEQQVEALARIEHQVQLGLCREMRKHPLGSWVKRTVGVGEKQGARLLAAIGDPYWNAAEDRPRRGPAELWAYCGMAPGQKRRKGVKSNWNATAKMRAHLVAESCMKKRHSPFRPKYDEARAKWADRDTTDLHKHNHALRVTAKEMLKDLFLEAKRVHEETA